MKEHITKHLGFIAARRKLIARHAKLLAMNEALIDKALGIIASELTPEDLRPMEEADLKFGTLFFFYDRLSQAYAHGYVSEKLNSFHFEGADGCDYTLHYKFVLKD